MFTSPKLIVARGITFFQIRKIESQVASSSAPIHPSCIFEIVDPYARTIKSVKLQSRYLQHPLILFFFLLTHFYSKGPSEGGHERFVLMAANPEEADEWVNILQNNVLGNPLLSLIKKRKSQVTRKSAVVGRQTPAFPPPNISPSLASSSASSHKSSALLPATIDPSDTDINLSPPPSPKASSSAGSSGPSSHSPLSPVAQAPEAS